MAGTVVNTVVMAAVQAARNISKLVSHGDHIKITKMWSRSLLARMGFVKKKCSTSGEIPLAQFERVKEIFLADLTTEIVMKDIPNYKLGSNWFIHYPHW